MLWNVPPDVLPGSATAVYVLDRWLNGCFNQFNASLIYKPGVYQYLDKNTCKCWISKRGWGPLRGRGTYHTRQLARSVVLVVALTCMNSEA